MARYFFEQQQEVGEIELGETSRLVVSLIPQSGGERVVGLREWKDEGPTGYSGPTKQGLMLPVAVLEGVIVALNRVQTQLLEEELASEPLAGKAESKSPAPSESSKRGSEGTPSLTGQIDG
jgi:hypothetical protein